jgi:hypothetical protein
VIEVAFVTCARLPELDADDRLAIPPLEALGCRVVPVAWDDPSVDWDRFALSVIRSTWDYTDRRDEFVRWAQRVPRLLNPAVLVEWNTDKRYLSDLEAAGVPVVPTTWVPSADGAYLPQTGEYVIKPAVGAGSLDAERYVLSEVEQRARAAGHVERLIASGQTVMVQPFMSAVETSGETGVVFIDGQLSHAFRKGVMLGPSSHEEVEGLYKEETIDPCEASQAELDVANDALNAALRSVTVDQPLLYARVDMVPDATGRPVIMELELTEPSLFMTTAPDSYARFATAIAARAARI